MWNRCFLLLFLITQQNCFWDIYVSSEPFYPSLHLLLKTASISVLAFLFFLAVVLQNLFLLFLGMDFSLVPFIYAFIIFFCTSLTSHLYWLLTTFLFFPSIYYIAPFHFQLLPFFHCWARMAFCQSSQLDISQSAEMLRLLAATLTNFISLFLAFLLVSLPVSSYCFVSYLDRKLFS